MNDKTTLAARLLALPDTSPQIAEITAIIDGRLDSSPEKYLTLRDVAQEVGLHASWLHRLQVPSSCGHRIAGRKRYKVSEVQAYLESDRCHVRVRELSEQRKAVKK